MIVLMLAGGICAAEKSAGGDAEWFLESICAPRDIRAVRSEPVVVAVVDDGVRITHQDLRNLIWVNPKEVAGNGIDDDGNGFVDDVHGWDVADHDNTATPPADRLEEFYHGTHVAGIVASIVKAAYGERGADCVRIMAVKCLTDRADKTYLKSGYKGIEYAVKAGADVIVCAWGVGSIAPNEAAVLDSARAKGIFIVGSAGSFAEGRQQYPAAHDGVVAVAALDRSGNKIERSNFGGFVDLSAPGLNISSASSLSDTGYAARDGSSQAAAIVAGAAVIMKQQRPEYSSEMITACLKNSATAMEIADLQYSAKLGAGMLNVKAAVESELFAKDTAAENELLNPQGYLHFRGTGAASWSIKPAGEFKGLRFKGRVSQGSPGKSTVSFYCNRSGEVELLGSYPVTMLGEGVYVPGTTAYVTFEPKGSDAAFEWVGQYRAEPIDFSTLYCRDTVQIDAEGTFSDGSGDKDYSPGCSCKWLITAPQGKVIDIRFREFDTEAKTDLVYFFDGTGTHEPIMAIFSGPKIPPGIITWRNQVLVWFVTNGTNQGKGWRAEVKFVDP